MRSSPGLASAGKPKGRQSCSKRMAALLAATPKRSVTRRVRPPSGRPCLPRSWSASGRPPSPHRGSAVGRSRGQRAIMGDLVMLDGLRRGKESRIEDFLVGDIAGDFVGLLDPIFPGWARLAPEKLLLCRPLVNRNARLAANASCKKLLDPGPRANPGCSHVAGRSRRMVPPSAPVAPWSAPVRPPPRSVLAGGRSGAGSRRTRRVALPPRPAGTRRNVHGARSGRRSPRASRAAS
jgi:hypothetical protein